MLKKLNSNWIDTKNIQTNLILITYKLTQRKLNIEGTWTAY